MKRSQRSRPDIQYRTVAFRANQTGTGFSGYAAHFWSADSWWTAIKPGAFRKTLKERGDRIPVLWQHNPDWPIGRPTALKEDRTGLHFDATISEATTFGRDAMALLRDDVPLGMSFGFQTVKDRPATDDDPIDLSQLDGNVKKSDLWVIEEIKLWEISLVTFPANDRAEIHDVRSAAEADALRSLIEHIRAGELSDEHAALVADLVAAYQRTEPEPGEPTPLPAMNARHRIRAAQGLLALRQHGIITGGNL